MKRILLNFDFCASFGELSSESVSVCLGDAFLDCLGSAFNEILCVLQTETGNFADNLDDVELTSACGLQDNVEFSLFFSCCCCGSCTCCCDCDGSCGNAEFFFESLNEVCEFENSESLNFFENLSGLLGSHFS